MSVPDNEIKTDTGRRALELKRDWLFVGCEAGHDWISSGGCNAGCDRDCVCSVPVNECSRCGAHDFGLNADAYQIVAMCGIRTNLEDHNVRI